MAAQPPEVENWHDSDYQPHTGSGNSSGPPAADPVAVKTANGQNLANWGFAGNPPPGPTGG